MVRPTDRNRRQLVHPPPSPPINRNDLQVRPPIQAPNTDISNLNRRRQRPRRAPATAPALGFSNEVIHNILIRTNVSLITRCRILSRWFSEQFSSATLIADFRRLNLEVPMQLWTVTHYLLRSSDRHGLVRMVEGGNRNRVTTHSLENFDMTGILHPNEVAFLFYVWRNLFVYRVHIYDPNERHVPYRLTDRRAVALVVFNLTDFRQTSRIELPFPQFNLESFGMIGVGNGSYALRGDVRILVNPVNGNTIMQYVDRRTGSGNIVYYEFVLGAGGTWRSWFVERVRRLTRAEREHPLAMFPHLGFLTFRNNIPVLLPVDREATQSYFTTRGIDTPGHTIHGGPCRYTFVLGVTPEIGSERNRITSVRLYFLVDTLNSYQFVAEASHHFVGRLLYIRSRSSWRVFMDPPYVFLTFSFRAGYLIICYNLLLRGWSTYSSEHINFYDVSAAFLTRVTF